MRDAGAADRSRWPATAPMAFPGRPPWRLKRRKTGARRIGVITDAQRFHLICGRYFFDYAGEADHFRDDAHRRATWAAHREQILAEWDHPGERPIALWAYDLGLKPAPYPKLWSWPRPIGTEAEAVYRLIERGELAPCRFNGTVPIASEMQEIASRWELLIRCPHLGYSGQVPASFAAGMALASVGRTGATGEAASCPGKCDGLSERGLGRSVARFAMPRSARGRPLGSARGSLRRRSRRGHPPRAC